MADDSQRTRSSQEMSRATPGDAIHQEFLLEHGGARRRTASRSRSHL